MTFPDLAEALPSCFKKNRIATAQQSKTLVCNPSAPQNSGILSGDVVVKNFADGHSILLLCEESPNGPIAFSHSVLSPFLEYHDLLKLPKNCDHCWKNICGLLVGQS